MIDVIEFFSAVVSRRHNGEIVIALMDGEAERRCVCLLMCSEETAASLSQGIGSELKVQGAP